MTSTISFAVIAANCCIIPLVKLTLAVLSANGKYVIQHESQQWGTFTLD